MRFNYLGGRFCKDKGKALTSAKKAYLGLGFFFAGAAAFGPKVVDSRSEFVGHADIRHRFASPPKGVPFAGPDMEALKNDCKQILELTTFVRDEKPDSNEWSHGCPISN